MEEQVPWYVSLVVSWIPFAVWIWATLLVGTRIAKVLKTADGRSLASVVDDFARELKRQNDLSSKSPPQERPEVQERRPSAPA
jgi:hypothetical protein